MSNSITLRQAEDCDMMLAYEIKKAAFSEYVDQLWGWEEEEQLRVHKRRFAEHQFHIVQMDSKDIGVMATSVECSCLELHQLFIYPAYQSRGIGEECMKVLMDKAQELRTPLRLSVLKVNPRARVFYERLGFAITGETETHTLMEWSEDTISK